jgi:hypothetical protein
MLAAMPSARRIYEGKFDEPRTFHFNPYRNVIVEPSFSRIV